MSSIHRSKGSLKTSILALACALALAGCSGLPFEVPDLPNVPNPLEAFGATPSVEEAIESRAATTSAQLTADDLVQEGVLTVGLQTGSVSAPFVIVADDGTLSGLDIDVASAIADHLGLSVRFVPVEGVEAPLASGQCDVVMGAVAGNAGSAIIMGDYYESAVAFFHRGEQRVVTVDELMGKTVALQDGSVSQGELDRTALGMMQVTYGNLNEAFAALEAGQIDYVLCDAYSGGYLASAYGDIAFAGALSAPSPISVATSADKGDIQIYGKAALDAVLSDGAMDVVRSSWVGGLPTITGDLQIVGIPAAEGTQAEGTGEDGAAAGANAVILY